MKPEQIFNPFIVYWDIHTSSSDDRLIDRICDELVRTKIFILNLRDLSETLSSPTFHILERLKGESIEVNLTSGEGFLEEYAGEEDVSGINKLYIEEESPQQIEHLLNRMKLIKDGEFKVGLSFPFKEMTFRNIPAVVSLCIRYGIRNLQVPIHRHYNRNIFCIDSGNDQWLSGELKQINMESMNLSIHDPFLWKIFNGGDNPNIEGCNGAKTMIYISEELEVTPCPIMSLSLGNLKDNSLEEIFLSEKRSLIRRDLSSSPLECDGCSHVKDCKGGCRGRTYVLCNSFEKKDPACILRK